MHEVRAFFDGQNVQFTEPLGERAPQNVVVHFLEDEKTKAVEPDLAKRFEQLFQRWHTETRILSDGGLKHPAFFEIVELGHPVVPLILAKLEQKFYFIGSAILKITGENPVRPEHRGRPDLVAEDWLRWGEERNLIRR